MTIIEAFKKNTIGLRLSYGSRWLVWSEDIQQWSVYEHRPYQKFSTSLIRTSDEEKAIGKLLED